MRLGGDGAVLTGVRGCEVGWETLEKTGKTNSGKKQRGKNKEVWCETAKKNTGDLRWY